MAFRILFASLLATATGQSIVISLLPSLGREAQLAEWQIALMMSSSAFIFALGTNLWSRVAAVHGFRRVLMLGLVGYTVGTLVFASIWWLGFQAKLSLAALFVLLLLSRSLQSSIMSATPPATIGYALRIAPAQQRVQALGKVTSANHLGQVVGPSAVGLLVPLGMLTPLFAVAGATFMALLWVTWRLPEAPPADVQSTSSANTATATDSLPTAVVCLLLASACLFCCLAMLQQSLGFYFMDAYGKTPPQAAQQLGIFMLVSAVASLTTQLTFVQRTAWSATALIKVSLALLIAVYLIIWQHNHHITLLMSALLLGVGMGMAFPSLTAAATSQCSAQQQAKVTGLITATPAMGYIVGPPLGAGLYRLAENAPFLAAALLLLVIWLSLLHFQRSG